MIRHELKEDEFPEGLARLAAALTDMTPLMQDLGELMVRSTEQNFATGTDPEGNAWAPRKPSTLAAYAKRGDTPGPRPLIGPSKSLSTTISHAATATSVEWGSNMIYAAVMQLGAAQGEFGARIGKDKNGRDFFMTIPWGDIPARPFLGVGPTDRENILETITEYLATAAGD